MKARWKTATRRTQRNFIALAFIYIRPKEQLFKRIHNILQQSESEQKVQHIPLQKPAKVAAVFGKPHNTFCQVEGCTHTSHEDTCQICMLSGIRTTTPRYSSIWCFHFLNYLCYHSVTFPWKTQASRYAFAMCYKWRYEYIMDSWGIRWSRRASTVYVPLRCCYRRKVQTYGHRDHPKDQKVLKSILCTSCNSYSVRARQEES